MIEFRTWGTYGAEIHYEINGREVTREQYESAWTIEQLVKGLK